MRATTDPPNRRKAATPRRWARVAHGAVRRATLRDLAAMRTLESAAFQPYRQASPASLRRSLTSPRQSVWVIDAPQGLGLDALLVLWHHPHRVRVYDIATHPRRQGQGLGHLLMQHAAALARSASCAWLTLEADPKEPGLVAWYKKQGFRATVRLPAYYKNGNAAVRLVKRVS